MYADDSKIPEVSGEFLSGEILFGEILYQDGDLLLEQSGGELFLSMGGRLYQLSDYPYEPCLYIKGEDGFTVSIRQAFSVEELRRAARTRGSIGMITGDRYDLKGICMLIRKALALGRDSVDLSYLEGCCFADYLKEHGAISEESALPLRDWGRITNPNVLNPFLHAKIIKRTKDGRYCLGRSRNSGGEP